MGGMFGGGKAQSQRQTPAGALNVQTSIYGSVFPLAYGKNRSPVNLIHYVNFRAIPHTTKQRTGGKGGGKTATNTTYTYKVAFAASFAVGGTGVSVGTVWKNKEKHTAASLGLTIFSGAAGQTAWSYLIGAYPSQAVPYANLGYMASASFELGDSPSLPNLNVEIIGLLPFDAGTIDDAEPSAIITDYCSNTRHGAGFGSYLADLTIGPASFRTYCVARGLFLSPIENNQRNAGVFIKEIADICNSAAVWKNGKLHLIPYGDTVITGNGVTYTPDLTPLYDLTVDDFLFEQNQPPVKHSEKNPSQRFNHVRIEYNARENDYNPLIVEAKDRADIDDNGLRTKAVAQYKCITKREVARDVAQLQMQSDLFRVNSYAFRLGVRHSLLEPMDYVTITEPDMGLDRLLVRITEVIEQDDAVDIVAEEVSVGIANAPAFSTTAPQGYNQDFNAEPGAVNDPLIMNAPGMLTATGYEMWLNVSGVSPSLWGGCQVWVSDDDIEYRLVGSIYGPARYGALTANMAAGSADYDTTSVLRVQLYNGELLGGTQEDVDDFRTLLYVGGEWMSYRDATLVSGTTYDVDTFRRAAYGSERTAHVTGDAVAVIDEATFRLPYDAGNVGKTIYFKLPSFNVFGAGLQDLSDCDAYPHTIGASELTASINLLDSISVSDQTVLNPNFEQGFFGWSQIDSGFYLESGPNALSGTSAFKTGGLTTFARLLNERTFRVRPGQVVLVSGMIANVGSANGSAYVSLVLRDKNGSIFADKLIPFSSAPVISGSAWRNVSKKIILPSGSATAQICGVVDGHTSGSWGFDNFRAGISEDFFRGSLSGESLIPNYNFSGNEGTWFVGAFAAEEKDPVTDGWYVFTNNSPVTFQNSVFFGVEANTSDANLRQLFIGDVFPAGAVMNANSSVVSLAATYEEIPVKPGEKYWVECVGRADQANARPSGINYTVYMGLWAFAAGGDTAFAFLGFAGNNVSGGDVSSNSVVTIPTGTAFVKGVVGVIWTNSNGTSTSVPFATCHFRAQSLRVRRQATLDDGVITDGTVYGRTANTDLIDDGGVRRIGLNVKNSRIMLGGARNARASLVAGFESVRTATALSANSSGQITVNAHSIEISGETVSYSGVTNAVTGGTVGLTYVVYTLDPYLDGGVRTYYKQTTILSAQQAGEGAVFIGNVTIPASGSSSGGESGTGGPGSWCVDADTMLPDGRYLRDLALGDMVECVDVVTGHVHHYPLLAMKFGREECYRLVSENGAMIVQSKSAPMNLPNGKTVTTVDMFGRPVYTKTNSTPRLSHVVDIQYIGERPVLKPDFGNRMFFAGERAEATIATHNASAKP